MIDSTKTLSGDLTFSLPVDMCSISYLASDSSLSKKDIKRLSFTSDAILPSRQREFVKYFEKHFTLYLPFSNVI